MGKKKTERKFTPVHNIKEYLEVVHSHGDKTLYRWLENNEYVSNTYNEFYAKVIGIAKGYQKIGLAGKRIAVIGETSVEWIATYLATVISGGEIDTERAAVNVLDEYRGGKLGQITLEPVGRPLSACVPENRPLSEE